MNKLKSSAAAKIIAVVLIIIALGAAAGSALGVGLLESYNAYSDGLDAAKTNILDAVCLDRSYDAVRQCSDYDVLPDYIYPDSAFCFTVTDSDGNVVYDNLDGRETLCSSSAIDFGSSAAFFAGSAHSVYVNTDRDGRNIAEPSVMPTQDTHGDETAEAEVYVSDDSADMTRRRFTLTGYILKDIPADDNVLLALRALDIGYNMRYGLFAIAAASLLAAVLLFVYLMAAAGHKADGEIRGGFIEKIPFDIYTAMIVLIEVLVVGCAVNIMEEIYVHWTVRAILALLGAAVFAAIALLWCMSWSVRIKLRTTLKGCLCYRILAWLWRGIRKLFTMLIDVIKGLPLISRAALITGGVLLVEFIYLAVNVGDGGAMLFGWFIERAILVTLLLYALIGMKKLLAAGKEIAAGNISYTVDTSKMRGVVREHGEDLNNIGVGMNKAVAERMKSERFKTELITNVSHDIRTPLTSIISYVDLLSKENPDNAKEQEYIEVLERQSARLKKLIDDLIEASKASTGNLTVNAERCDLGMLIGQTAGEYAEKLEKAQLELVQSVPEESVAILADGRHMWRIFDNLLSNACKYSQNGTRVYLALEKRDGMAVVSFKNISKTQLNISGDELMERFVRGDSARNTEGSGLGLSIARSLTQLQHGEMNISIDGDLFKVTLSFPVVE